MAALTIAGRSYDVLIAGAIEGERIRSGSATRSFSFVLRSQIRAEKRQWGFVTEPVTQAQWDLLLADTALGAVVACAGDLLAATYNCVVLVRESTYMKDGVIKRFASLLLTQA